MTTRSAQREATRARILDAARSALARDGYEAVSLAALMASLGITKGAFYHHFASKEQLFRAVLETVVDEVGERIAAAADAESDAVAALRAGCLVYLDTASDPSLRRILLQDGPAVVGWSAWLTLDEASPATHLGEALTDLATAGRVVDAPLDALTRLLSGAINETAMWVAASSDPSAADRARAALNAILDGIIA